MGIQFNWALGGAIKQNWFFRLFPPAGPDSEDVNWGAILHRKFGFLMANFLITEVCFRIVFLIPRGRHILLGSYGGKQGIIWAGFSYSNIWPFCKAC